MEAKLTNKQPAQTYQQQQPHAATANSFYNRSSQNVGYNAPPPP